MFHKSSLSNQYLSVLIRRQPPEVFCQGGVFWGISWGSLEGACAGVSIFHRVACLRPDRDAPAQVFFCWFCGISGSVFSAELLRTTASVNSSLIFFSHSIVFLLIISYIK